MSSLYNKKPLAVLIATKQRKGKLTSRSLPSINQQTKKPDVVVIVQDNQSDDLTELVTISSQYLSEIEDVVVLKNVRTAGVAGAWNSGLDWIRGRFQDSYVAIIDDDDTWDDDHIECCLDVACSNGQRSADVVVSGQRFILNGVEQQVEPVSELCWKYFLFDNPGWRGSNTFMSINFLYHVGGFDEALVSSHDRDLAIRVLKHSGLDIRYTGKFTSTWFLDTNGDQLSCRMNPLKAKSVYDFWNKYGGIMSDYQASQYWDRADRLFGVKRGS
ncbi:hypothetical protein JCM14469_38170 [Desulfatiferula olefinivorans]